MNLGEPPLRGVGLSAPSPFARFAHGRGQAPPLRVVPLLCASRKAEPFLSLAFFQKIVKKTDYFIFVYKLFVINYLCSYKLGWNVRFCKKNGKKK